VAFAAVALKCERPICAYQYVYPYDTLVQMLQACAVAESCKEISKALRLGQVPEMHSFGIVVVSSEILTIVKIA